MATWQELRGYIASNYRLSEDDGTSLTLVLDVGEGRTQSVFVSYIDVWGQVLIESPFAEVAKCDLTILRSILADTLVGIRSNDTHLLTSHQTPIDYLQPEEFEVPLHLSVSVADDLEKRYFGGDEY